MKDFDQEKVVAGILFAATVLVAQGHGNRCPNKGDIERYDRHNHSVYECWPASECHDGQQLSVEPGSSHSKGTEIICQECPKNYFSNNRTDKRCRKCTSCGHKEELFPCTTVKDRECATRCISNEFYFNATDNECYPCAECCEANDENIEPQCITMRIGTLIGGKGQKHCRRTFQQCDELPKNNLSSPCMSCDTCLHSCSWPKNCSLVEMEWRKNNLSGSGCGDDFSSSSKSIDSLHISLIICSVLAVVVAIGIVVGSACKKRRQSSRKPCSYCLALSESCFPCDCSLVPGSSASADHEGQMYDAMEMQSLIASCREKLNCIPEEMKLNELQYEVEEKITKLLDGKRPYVKNWWDVGRMIGIHLDDLGTLKREDDREGGSPTRCLLGILRTWPGVLSLKKLAEVIHNVGRHDICDTFCECFQRETSSA